MLSSKAKYALRAMLALGEEAASGRWTSAQTIAERADVPRKFLEAILVQLRDQGVIESRRGPIGGHKLLVAAETLNVADVIRIIDGPIALTPCASRTRFGVCKDCKDARTCQLTQLMQQVRDATAGVLEGCSIADLARAPKLPTHAPKANASRLDGPKTDAAKVGATKTDASARPRRGEPADRRTAQSRAARTFST